MENFINSLPKHILALIVIIVGIIVFFLISPPHTVCDTQEEVFKERQVGNIFPTPIKKNKIPAILGRAKEACQLGNSAGACYEYLMALKNLADGLNNSASECVSRLYEISEVKSAMNDGIEVIARLAWGGAPPERPEQRFGWLQESEIAVFCRLKKAYVRANGEENWFGLKNRIFPKLPGEVPPESAEPEIQTEGKKALEVLSEEEVWSRSLFAVSCDNY
jgi:hypothetical protein